MSCFCALAAQSRPANSGPHTPFDRCLSDDRSWRNCDLQLGGGNVCLQAAATSILSSDIGRNADVHVVAGVCRLWARNGAPNFRVGSRDTPIRMHQLSLLCSPGKASHSLMGSSRFQTFGSGTFAAFQRYSLKNALLQGKPTGDEFAEDWAHHHPVPRNSAASFARLRKKLSHFC